MTPESTDNSRPTMREVAALANVNRTRVTSDILADTAPPTLLGLAALGQPAMVVVSDSMTTPFPQLSAGSRG